MKPSITTPAIWVDFCDTELMSFMIENNSKILSPKVIRNFQFFNIPLFRAGLVAVLRNRSVLIKPHDIQTGLNYVIVSNHQGSMDAFYVCYSLGFDIHQKLGPYRYFIANRFLKYPLLTQLLLVFGCFPAKRHSKYPYGLRAAEHLVADDQTVMIFPEGKVSQTDRHHKPKTGVEVLARMKDVRLIPARVRRDRNKKFIKSYSLAIGRPFDGSKMSAEQIMDEVYSLKFE